MENRWTEFAEGEIRFRDDLQFELKSEFAPVSGRSSAYTQEFYTFIPNGLQVNSSTYSKQQFYQDQTNLIRYRTPEVSFADLINSDNSKSPLTRIKHLLDETPSATNRKAIQLELKLFGNIVRSTLRRRTLGLIQAIEKVPKGLLIMDFEQSCRMLFQELLGLRQFYEEIRAGVIASDHDTLTQHTVNYIDEFISNSIEYFVTALLEYVQQADHSLFGKIDTEICDLLTQEMEYRQHRLKVGYEIRKDEEQDEFLLYRKGLLNKFVIDSLLLPVDRMGVESRYQHLFGAFAAGVAMLVYLLLWIWQGAYFVINSISFVAITVILYMLKDRMKEYLRSYFLKIAFSHFPDYETKIWTPDSTQVLGFLRESFGFLGEERVSKKIYDLRNRGFHTQMQDFPRPETVLYYRRELNLNGEMQQDPENRAEITTVFRLNIHKFIQKAANARTFCPHFDPKTRRISYDWLRKVYHINIIMKNSYENASGVKVEELTKFRLIVNKMGIKRVERLG